MFSDTSSYLEDDAAPDEGAGSWPLWRVLRWLCCCGCIDYCVVSVQEWRSRTARDRKKRSIRVIRQEDPDSSAEEQSLLGRTPSITSSGCSSSSSRDLKADLYSQIERRRTTGPGRSARPVSAGSPVAFWSGVPATPLPPMSFRRNHGLQPQLYQVHEEELRSPQLPAADVGRIQFSMVYRAVPGTLQVRILEARNLVAPVLRDSVDLAHSNPYVRLSLIPGPRRCRQTRVKRRTQNPRFDETFTFDVAFKELARLRLQLLVKDFDKYSRQCVVGEVTVPLSQPQVIAGELLWRPLLPCLEDEDCGDVLLTLGYLPRAGRLNIDLVRCRYLPSIDITGRTDPCVRVSLVLGERHAKTKRTSCHKMTTDPVFNERLSFGVAAAELAEVSLVVSVYDGRSAAVRQEPVGRLVFGRHATGPEEVAHWSHMTRAHRAAGSRWHRLKTRSFCDKMSPAAQIVP